MLVAARSAVALAFESAGSGERDLHPQSYVANVNFQFFAATLINRLIYCG